MQELVIFFYVLAAGFLVALYMFRDKVKRVRVDYSPMIYTEHCTIWSGDDFMVLMGAEKMEVSHIIKTEYYMYDGVKKKIRESVEFFK